ncbi:hypothetical protein ACQ4LE_010880 [Meloidogyne hapla]|uniref:ANK_REP_REGION domain-containing protein n=1 Tax=Meloidogyne hapla TaxID=6305 RepID=A0A1I8BNA3_MELHA
MALDMFEKDAVRDSFNELIQYFHDKEFDKAERLLLEQPNLRQYSDSTGRKAVHYAAASGHYEFVKTEIAANHSLVYVVDDDHWTILMIAASAGQLEIVRLLLSYSKDDFMLSFPQRHINHKNKTGQTALHYACSKDHVQIVQELLDKGADINAPDERGATPLHRAASKGNKRTVNLLLGYKNKLQINLVNREGDTALHLACEDDQQEVAILLANCGANISKTNREGKTPLDLVKDAQLKQKLNEAVRSSGS